MHPGLDRDSTTWGRHICTDNSKTYVTNKSYSVGANIKLCYVSVLPCSQISFQLKRSYSVQALGEGAVQSNREFYH